MDAPHLRTSRSWPAVLAAGPVFVGAMLLLSTIGPDPVPVDFGSVVGLLGAVSMLLPFVLLVGSMLAVVPILLGTALLQALARISPAAESAVIWWLTGAAAGAIIAIVLEVPVEAHWVMAATGAVCAGISHAGQRW